MAKHFKQAPAEVMVAMKKTRSGPAKQQADMGATVPQQRIDATVPQVRLETDGYAARIDAESTSNSLPYGQAASYRAFSSEAAPTGEFFMGEVPARGGGYAVGRGFLLFFAWLMRLCAIAMVLLVLLNALGLSVLRPTLTNVTDAVNSFLPWHEAPGLSVDTPFGGVFRGDLALVALGLFLLDWVLCKVRAGLR